LGIRLECPAYVIGLGGAMPSISVIWYLGAKIRKLGTQSE
jgi:hypothetical protein